MTQNLSEIIDEAWERRETLDSSAEGGVRDAVERVLDGLDSGRFRVAEKSRHEWQVRQWLKKAVLLSFRLNPARAVAGGPADTRWWDKVEMKFAGWSETQFREAGFRAVPGALV